MKSECRPASWYTKGAAQSKPVEPQDTFELRKSHLDLLALAQRLFETLRANERPGDSRGRTHGYRAGSCVMVALGSTAV
jgi:hypothetical protein